MFDIKLLLLFFIVSHNNALHYDNTLFSFTVFQVSYSALFFP